MLNPGDVASRVIPCGHSRQPKHANIERNEDEIDKLLNSKGRFMLATNDLDEVNFSGKQMLNKYKEQQNVEGGFRFIKDPSFMLDSIFLKSPKRIEALMMLMTLCLMVYNIAQYKLRQRLKTENETLPNQLNKEVKNPTIRWIFQVMEGINIIQFYQNNVVKPSGKIWILNDGHHHGIVREFESGGNPIDIKICEVTKQGTVVAVEKVFGDEVPASVLILKLYSARALVCVQPTRGEGIKL